MTAPDSSSIPLPLIFGPFDPSGASNLPADSVICARLGAHAGVVVTALHVQDTSRLESVQRLAPDLIDDQARCLLEDMPISAIKVGPQYDPETIAVLAQIAADYSTVPLVLHLGTPPSVPDLQDLDPEETIAAALELLAPQAQVVILDARLPGQWASQGLLSAPQADTPVAALQEIGVPYVLCTNDALSVDLNGLSLYASGRAGQRWPWPAPRVRAADAEGLLATVLACRLAGGSDALRAIQQAAEITPTMLEHHFHPGMGQRILLHAGAPMGRQREPE